VTPSGRMECGVTLSGRRISLKGAVAHLFLSFLLPFPSSRNNLFRPPSPAFLPPPFFSRHRSSQKQPQNQSQSIGTQPH